MINLKKGLIIIIFTIIMIILSGCINNSDTEKEDKKDSTMYDFYFEEELINRSTYSDFAKGYENNIIREKIYFENITRIEFFLDYENWERWKDNFTMEINPPNNETYSFSPSNRVENKDDWIKIICIVQKNPLNVTATKNEIKDFKSDKGTGIWTLNFTCYPTAHPSEEEWRYGDDYVLEIAVFGYHSVIIE